MTDATAHSTPATDAPPESPAPCPRLTDVSVDGTLVGWTPARHATGDSTTTSAQSSESASDAFRAQLGLPADRPIVMTGHQATFWHAGILAKYLAADAIRARADGRVGTGGEPVAVAWCVPDHVAESPGLVEYPIPAGDGAVGKWARASVDLLDPEDLDSKHADLPAPLAEAAELLKSADGERDADRQIAAQAELLDRRLGLRTNAPIVRASRLHETDLFRELVERMRRDADGCVRAYNAAVEAHPDAGVRPLMHTETKTELPLWRIDDRGRAHALYLDDLCDDEPGDTPTPIERIRPRALLFTGLLRARACDLFIHGTGGGVYDAVTEAWLGDWLGWTLAPAGVATATLTPDLGVPDANRADLSRAKWRAHHARHNPGAIGDAPELAAAQERKRALVEKIAQTPRGERDPLFEEMHAMLGDVRTRHADGLAVLDAEVDKLEAALADRAIAGDRTFPWILHRDADLAALRSAVRDRLGAADA